MKNKKIKGWNDVTWNIECVRHFMYRMPSVEFLKKGRITDPDPKNLYVPPRMQKIRDNLLKKLNFNLDEYTKLGDQYLSGETARERLEAQKKLFNMFTPIYSGLKQDRFSNEKLFG